MMIKIPEQPGVVGANEPFGEHKTPSLSSINQQTIKMGDAAFGLLLDLINDESIGAGNFFQEIIDGKSAMGVS
jgi:LacI family transcriptional regulator